MIKKHSMINSKMVQQEFMTYKMIRFALKLFGDFIDITFGRSPSNCEGNCVNDVKLLLN